MDCSSTISIGTRACLERGVIRFEGWVEYKNGKRFRFFIRFNVTEPQVAFFLKSLPHPFAFGTRELALDMRQLGIAKNVEWEELP